VYCLDLCGLVGFQHQFTNVLAALKQSKAFSMFVIGMAVIG
jgi:hypothetical protein